MQVGMIGRGYWGSKVERYIKECFDLKYIADSKFDKNIIWNDKDIAGVIVMTPMNTHFEIIKEALLHGKHVYTAKPLTLRYAEALELRELAIERDKVLAVDYTQTFSPSLLAAKKHIEDIGDLEFIEMGTKHLGRFFPEYDVYWLLASHHLSILDMFISLDELNFVFADCLYHNYTCTTGCILFEYGKIDISLNFPGKELQITFYGSKGTIQYMPLSTPSLAIVKYNKEYKKLPEDLIENAISYSDDEQNNLGYSIRYFKELIGGTKETNIDTAVKITKILERRDEKSYNQYR